jgi:hypothetical protein
VHPFVEGSFDAVISRFDTMFFDDPEAAFTNFHSALDPDGRRRRRSTSALLSGFRVVAILPMKRTPQNTGEPLDGVVRIRGRGVAISRIAGRRERLVRAFSNVHDFGRQGVVPERHRFALRSSPPDSRSPLRTHRASPLREQGDSVLPAHIEP